MEKDAYDVIGDYKKYQSFYFNNYTDVSNTPDIKIIYKDIEDQITERELTILEIAQDVFTQGKRVVSNDLKIDYIHGGKEDWIHAYCHLRDAGRQFRLSRIHELIDLRTGEYIEKKDFKTFFKKLYESSAGFTSEILIKKFEDELMILNYIADLDDRFTAKEKSLIYDYLNEKCNKAITDDEKLFIDNLIGKNLSSQPKALKAVKKIKELNDDTALKLITAIENILSLTKKINPVVEAGAKMIMEKLK